VAGKPALQRDRLLANRIENAAVSRLRRRRCSVVPPSPKSFSKTACGLFSTGSGTGGRAPGDGVEVGAAVAGAAAQAGVLDAQLERRQRRVLTDVLGDQLIHRDADAARRSSAAGRRSGKIAAERACSAPASAPVALACTRLLTTVSLSRYFSSGRQALGQLERAPFAAGVHLTWSPRAERRCSRTASWVRRRVSLQRRLRADHRLEERQRSVTPAPRRNVRRDEVLLGDEHIWT
jgi:hypothetical protein